MREAGASELADSLNDVEGDQMLLDLGEAGGDVHQAKDDELEER